MIAGNGADFAGDADEAVEVRTIWGDLQIINDIAAGAAQIFGEGLAYSGIFAKYEQSFDLVRKAELLRRAHHAVGFDAADFADLDGKWLRAGFGRKAGAWQDKRHL